MSVCESFTWWHRPEPYFEKHPDEGMVERAGYMTTEQMVGELLRAGESLQVYRRRSTAGMKIFQRMLLLIG